MNPVAMASPDAGFDSQNSGEHSAQRDSRDTCQSQQREQKNTQVHQAETATPSSPSAMELETASAQTPVFTPGSRSEERHISVVV
jgi:hypothetical protein